VTSSGEGKEIDGGEGGELGSRGKQGKFKGKEHGPMLNSKAELQKKKKERRKKIGS